MPLTINVGLSKKTSENYNSQGASINLTAELDQSLLARPDELQGAVNELYEQAEYALVRQMTGSNSVTANPQAAQWQPNGTNGHNRVQAGNGHTNGRNGHGPSSNTSVRGMSQSQRKAIFAIADQLGIDPTDEARHEFGIDLDHASIGEASKLIDHLKSLQFSNRNGHHG